MLCRLLCFVFFFTWIEITGRQRECWFLAFYSPSVWQEQQWQKAGGSNSKRHPCTTALVQALCVWTLSPVASRVTTFSLGCCHLWSWGFDSVGSLCIQASLLQLLRAQLSALACPLSICRPASCHDCSKAAPWPQVVLLPHCCLWRPLSSLEPPVPCVLSMRLLQFCYQLSHTSKTKQEKITHEGGHPGGLMLQHQGTVLKTASVNLEQLGYIARKGVFRCSGISFIF